MYPKNPQQEQEEGVTLTAFVALTIVLYLIACGLSGALVYVTN